MKSLGDDLICFPGLEKENDPFPEISSFSLRQETIRIFGKEILQPRLSQLFGDEGVSYIYSRKKFDALPWNEFLIALRDRIEQQTGIRFNSALVNLYRDGNDSMGLHSDDEKELGKEPTIVSVSYGATRKMVFRRKSDGHKETIILKHGDVLLIQGLLQHNWKHEIPKAKGVTGQRMNITFRAIIC